MPERRTDTAATPAPDDTLREPRCGYTVLDGDGIEQPCNREATGWRWYQDVEHEDCLERACDWHANEGGRRIHSAEAAIERVRAIWREHTNTRGPGPANCRCIACDMARALDGPEGTDG